MYANYLPPLSKQKFTLDYLPTENVFALFLKLITCVENNVLTILNKIYECTGYLFGHECQSLYSCFVFNNREKLNQLRDKILMLVNFQYVVSMFLSGVERVNENIFCSINVETIRNVLFK